MKAVKGIGRAIGKVVSGVGKAVKTVLKSPVGRAIAIAAAVYFTGGLGAESLFASTGGMGVAAGEALAAEAAIGQGLTAGAELGMGAAASEALAAEAVVGEGVASTLAESAQAVSQSLSETLASAPSAPMPGAEWTVDGQGVNELGRSAASTSPTQTAAQPWTVDGQGVAEASRGAASTPSSKSWLDWAKDWGTKAVTSERGQAALIQGGFMMGGAALQGYGAQKMQDKQLQLEADARGRYNKNVGSLLFGPRRG